MFLIFHPTFNINNLFWGHFHPTLHMNKTFHYIFASERISEYELHRIDIDLLLEHINI